LTAIKRMDSAVVISYGQVFLRLNFKSIPHLTFVV